MMLMYNIFTRLLQLLVVTLVTSRAVQAECSRRQSKVVRQLIMEEILPVFKRHQLEVPFSCNLALERDIYGYQEESKFMESHSKWFCKICGKAFYEERFLEQHFESRHLGTRRQDGQAVCLAGYCDVFRCDIVASRSLPSSWDVALCKDSMLERTRVKCQDLLGACIPAAASEAVQKSLFAKLNQSVCGFLTCDNYWEMPNSVVEPVSIAFYILATVFLLSGLVIWYCVALPHMQTEVLSPDGVMTRHTPNPVPDSSISSMPLWDQDIRHRPSTAS